MIRRVFWRQLLLRSVSFSWSITSSPVPKFFLASLHGFTPWIHQTQWLLSRTSQQLRSLANESTSANASGSEARVFQNPLCDDRWWTHGQEYKLSVKMVERRSGTDGWNSLKSVIRDWRWMTLHLTCRCLKIRLLIKYCRAYLLLVSTPPTFRKNRVALPNLHQSVRFIAHGHVLEKTWKTWKKNSNNSSNIKMFQYIKKPLELHGLLSQRLQAALRRQALAGVSVLFQSLDWKGRRTKGLLDRPGLCGGL